MTEIVDFWAASLPKDSPYSRTVLGTTATVEEITIADCREFHRRFFVPNNMVLAVFGDIDPNKAFEQIEASFGAVPKAEGFRFPEFPTQHAPTDGNFARLTTQKEDTAMLMIGFPTVAVRDVETRMKLEVLNAILTGGGGIGGRLFQELRGAGLVYYVFGQELTGPAPGYFYFMAQTRPDSLQDVLKRIQANVSKIAKEGVPKEEFELARQKLIAAHSMDNVTPQLQAFQSAVDELLGLGYLHDREYEDRINQVQVDDLRQVVQQHFQRALIATSSPAASDATAPSQRAARRK
jgi:predicted Zn-dependent peptidase